MQNEAISLRADCRDIHNSITPSVYEVYARDIGMEIDFSLFNIEPEQLKGQVDFCRAHLDGFNVTMPYKQKLLESSTKRMIRR